MARASTNTLLALDTYAKIMGIPPMHFNGGATATVFPAGGSCNSVWWQHSWQANDRVSREDLAMAISDAEREIATALGWWPAPTWLSQEIQMTALYHRREFEITQVNNVHLKWGKVLGPGRRAASLVTAGVAVVLSDADGDGYSETVTITTPTTLTDECEVKVYFAGHGGDPEWEIRPLRTKAIVGGVFTATCYAWQIIDPDLWEAFPTTASPQAINLDLPGSLETTVDVYREYTDTAQSSATFYWRNCVPTVCDACGGSGCVACAYTTQEGCFAVRDQMSGEVTPFPAAYSAGAWTIADAWAVCRQPDFVKLWYQCGDTDERWRSGATCEPLSLWWAQAIAWMATARLERPFCSCGNMVALAQELRTDLARQPVNGDSFMLSDEVLACPFGTRKGEVMAWRRVAKFAGDGKFGGIAI